MTPPPVNVNTKCWNPIGCSGGDSGMVKAHYQHIAPGINHQWDVQPAVGPDVNSAPANQDCPLDGGGHGPLSIKYGAVYTKCMVCGYVKPW